MHGRCDSREILLANQPDMGRAGHYWILQQFVDKFRTDAGRIAGEQSNSGCSGKVHGLEKSGKIQHHRLDV